ncbi:MAG: hypothetical protein JWO41_136 [Candidatus Saccharibacteria bacterium]|nr:hypothetical protein [Candidatus Saccharibacteria bacterium]
MIKKIKNYVLVAMMALTMGAPALAPAVVYADNITTNLCTGVTAAAGGSGSCDAANPNDKLKSVASTIVNLLSVVVGIVSVIMIIYGGFKYITSGGDSGNVSGAKNTLVYAIVGLIIVALAQFIVHYVLSTAASTGLTS